MLGMAVAFWASSAWAVPNILSVVETGGDNEATDTIVAQFTGSTFVNGIANEPINPSGAGDSYSVGTFGSLAPAFVDRSHRYIDAPVGTPLAAGGTVGIAVPIPGYLVGGEYIMSGNDNRDNAGYRLDVTVAQDSIAFMLIDNRLGAPNSSNTTPPQFGPTKMQWILDEGWEPIISGNNQFGTFDRPDEVGFDEDANGNLNQWFSVYAKSFPAGTFSLRQADNGGQNMYGVVVIPNEVIPEPGTITLAAVGLSTLLLSRRLRRKVFRRAA
jgi:hypothetical protein